MEPPFSSENRKIFCLDLKENRGKGKATQPESGATGFAADCRGARQLAGLKRLFADSFFFIAFLSERDACHHRAVEASAEPGAFILTTRWVLAEVANQFTA